VPVGEALPISSALAGDPQNHQATTAAKASTTTGKATPRGARTGDMTLVHGFSPSGMPASFGLGVNGVKRSAVI
jgi:hypothetical protein